MNTQSVFNQNEKLLEQDQPEFFESLWIEVAKPLKEKLLIKVVYCSNVNLSKFFLDKMTSEISNVYSNTVNIILFGDYNKNILRQS